MNNSRAPANESSQSTLGLLRQLVEEVSTLFRKEVALAKSETFQAAAAAKSGAIALASGGFVLFAGFLVLLYAAVLALGYVVHLWLAAVIIGASVMIVGFILVQSGKKKLEPAAFIPEKTQASLQRDKEAVERRAR